MKRSRLNADPEKVRAFQQRRAPLRRTGWGRRGDVDRARKNLTEATERVQRWSIFAKGETECRICGRPATDLHHVIPRSRSRRGRDDLRNGLPICRPCHDYWHSGRPIYRDVFTAEEWAFIEELEYGLTGWLGRRYPVRPPEEMAA